VYVNWFKAFVVYTTAVTAKSENACANCDGSVVDPSRATIHVNGPVHSAISELMDSVNTLQVLFKETNKFNTQYRLRITIASYLYSFPYTLLVRHECLEIWSRLTILRTVCYNKSLNTKWNQTFYLQRAKIDTKHWLKISMTITILQSFQGTTYFTVQLQLI